MNFLCSQTWVKEGQQPLLCLGSQMFEELIQDPIYACSFNCLISFSSSSKVKGGKLSSPSDRAAFISSWCLFLWWHSFLFGRPFKISWWAVWLGFTATTRWGGLFSWLSLRAVVHSFLLLWVISKFSITSCHCCWFSWLSREGTVSPVSVVSWLNGSSLYKEL